MSFEQFGTGSCINCGLLGKRDKSASVSVCYEASAVDRLSGILTEIKGDPIELTVAENRPIIPTRPWCFLGKADLQGELAAIGAKEHQSDKVQQLIRKDRACPAWYPWREFLSPKEHWEEQMMLAMEKRREEFEQQMEQERRGFELRLEELNKEERNRSDKVMKWLAIAAISFAFAEVAAALLGITSDSWVLKLFR